MCLSRCPLGMAFKAETVLGLEDSERFKSPAHHFANCGTFSSLGRGPRSPRGLERLLDRHPDTMITGRGASATSCRKITASACSVNDGSLPPQGDPGFALSHTEIGVGTEG